MSNNSKKLGKHVVDFLVRQAGGEEEIMATYGVGRIEELGAKGATVEEVDKAAEKEGWLGTWKGISLGELVELFAPPESQSGSGTRGPRVPRETVQAGVLAVLQGADSPLSSAQVVEANEETQAWDHRCKVALGELVKTGSVIREGSRAASTYRIA